MVPVQGTGMSPGTAWHESPLPEPVPEWVMLPTATRFLQAMCPSTEKMAKPAKKLVQQFPMAMTKVSLPERVSWLRGGGWQHHCGLGRLGLPHHHPASPQLQPRAAPTARTPHTPHTPHAPCALASLTG